MKRVKEQAERMIEKAVQTYLNTPLPTIADLFDYHYANTPDQLEEQKRDALNREELRQKMPHNEAVGGHQHD